MARRKNFPSRSFRGCIEPSAFGKTKTPGDFIASLRNGTSWGTMGMRATLLSLVRSASQDR